MGKLIGSKMMIRVTVGLWWMVVVSMAAKVRDMKWTVEYKYWSPDCEGNDTVVMAINDQFPGPTIRAQAGDTLRIELTNMLSTEGVVIHWHGIRMLGTPWADGTAFISQCPINPGETFTYEFIVDKPGTYFYHGHYGMQRSAGLYGSLIVDVGEGKTEPIHYDDEFNLLLSDWWHNTVDEQEVGLASVPFRWIGEPQTLLINGRGQFSCSFAPNFEKSSPNLCKFNGSEPCSSPIFKVQPNKTYRIRLASSTALASLNFAIGGHKMTVVEADGNYITPFAVDDLDIYSGDSYSVLVTTNQDPKSNYWIRIGVRGRNPATQPALMLLNYVTTPSSLLPTMLPPTTPAWNDTAHSKAFTYKIFSSMRSPTPPLKSDRRMILLNTQNKYEGRTKWAINNVSLVPPPTPYLGSIKFGLKTGFDQNPAPEIYSPSSYDVMVPALNPNTTLGNGIYTITHNSVVDIILQNANALKPNVSEIHPWHLHGYDFWVLGYGDGKFKDGDEKTFNLKNPPLRNSVVVFPYAWTALRFIADNPGAWAFHCHIEPHLHMGMGVVLATATDKVKNIPTNAHACGLTANMKISP